MEHCILKCIYLKEILQVYKDTRVRISTSLPLKHMLTLHKLGNMTQLKGA